MTRGNTPPPPLIPRNPQIIYFVLRRQLEMSKD